MTQMSWGEKQEELRLMRGPDAAKQAGKMLTRDRVNGVEGERQAKLLLAWEFNVEILASLGGTGDWAWARKLPEAVRDAQMRVKEAKTLGNARDAFAKVFEIEYGAQKAEEKGLRL